jgi:hypothetical protein
MGGTDESSNIVELTIAEHATAHRLLYEQHGKVQDKIAWLMLSGKTTEAEKLRIALATAAFQEFVHDPVRSESWRQKISEGLRGKKHSSETIEKRSKSLKQAYKNNPELRIERSIVGKQHADEYRERMHNGLSQKMAAARKTSEAWHNAVRSPECRQKKSLSDPRRRAVIVEGQTYHSLREATRQTGYTYNKLRWHLVHNTDPDFIRYA